MWAVATVAGLAGAVLTVGLVTLTGNLGLGVSDGSLDRATLPAVSQPASTAAPNDSTDDIVALVAPAVVRLEVRRNGARSDGSGVVFRADGYLLTSRRLVHDADAIAVTLADGRELPGDLVCDDPVTDLGVVRVDADDLPVAVVGTTADLRIGEPAVCVAAGDDGPAVLPGTVSSLGQRLGNVDGRTLHGLVETDTPLPRSSAGGALVNGRGTLIGLATAVGSADQDDPSTAPTGHGYATPIDMAREVGDEIIMVGRAVHPWLGIEGLDLDAETAGQMGIDGGTGVQVVAATGPASAGGLEPEDVIVAFAGQPVDSMTTLVSALMVHDPGTEVVVDYLRDGLAGQRTVILGERR
ncbi:N/A [soil metagenome]